MKKVINEFWKVESRNGNESFNKLKKMRLDKFLFVQNKGRITDSTFENLDAFNKSEIEPIHFIDLSKNTILT